MNLTSTQQQKLDQVLSKVGDLNFKRRILTMLDYMNIQPGDKILDMGCGEGFYSMIFDQLFDVEVTAVDYDEEILSMAREWLNNATKVTLMQGDITNLPFEDNYFDKIVCTEVLEHIPDDVKAAKELFRVLKPGGVLAATVPNWNYPFMWDPLNKVREAVGLGHFNPLNGFWGGIWAYDHKRLYYPNDFKILLEGAGFDVEDLKVLTHYGVPFNHLVLYTGKQFYTSLPVSADVKNSMEKFKWDSAGEGKSGRQSILSYILSKGLAVLKWVDKHNDKEFTLDTSAMAVAALAKKKK
ncbi:MAG: class I SAM-dependent methyltransferase [Patescibacteria group bacterium]